MPGSSQKIYVQIDIGGPVEKVWHLTQNPDLHQRWDLRFTEICYLPRPDPNQPQRFLYATRIGFGIQIRGEGESVGSFDSPDGSRSSALKFWSTDPKSLIHQGSGYWKYVITGEGSQSTRFLTLYDYNVRFGGVGRLVDRLIFRSLIGWATAWSFDRLRLWIEKDIAPEVSMRHSFVYVLARLAIAFVWLYQGIIPKLIFKSADELKMLRAVIPTDAIARQFCVGIGFVEVGIGLALVLVWRSLSLLWFTLAAMSLAVLAVALKSPEFLTTAFNPISLNMPVFALAAIALLMARDLPTARHCIRVQPRDQS